MLCELRVTLLSNTPVIGFEITPTVTVTCRGSLVVPPHSVKFEWYRKQDQTVTSTCCVHHSEIATFQCMCCVMLKVPVKDSYYCSKRCFSETWVDHQARHKQAAETLSKLTDGSWLSTSSWFAYENRGLVDAMETVVEREGRSWIKVGSSKTYIPSADDFGCILRLESIATDSTEGNPLAPTNIILTCPVISAAHPRPRCLIKFMPQEGPSNFNLELQSSADGTFNVLSYNVLSQLYAYYIRYCDSWALMWEYRRHNLLREIIEYQADILCLQEVQSDHFENFFEPELVKCGYSVLYREKTNKMYTSSGLAIDGCATFFHRRRFKEIKRYELEYAKVASSVVSTLDIEKKNDAQIRLAKDNVALVVILEKINTDSDTSHPRICVANTHIHAQPLHSDVKLWQVATLINGLEKIAKSDIPVILCGDLNSLPGSAPYNLVVMGKVESDHQDMAEDPYGVFQHLVFKHSLHLVSAYASASGMFLEQQQRNIDPKTNEPTFTNFTQQFRGTLDYIFYTADSLKVEGLLELLDLETVTKYTALPSPEWSSDHVALMANFSFKPFCRQKDVKLPDTLW
ncbi:carbon catabolite repressor protein 4 homolog 1-like [Macadamia integrifolia]|uniref:carbon catabolite repressor protein 4 homolog 1-like n=1 Tax=Macadamia integrifolia TaxID=60698 RepID=UPI001C4F5CCD|nr:carbon catabolite repressor protein 4 homolog 1-like [Macadamia integrifolia]